MQSNFAIERWRCSLKTGLHLPSVSEVIFGARHSQDVTMDVTVPNTAAGDEYAVIPVIARVQEEGWALIFMVLVILIRLHKMAYHR